MREDTTISFTNPAFRDELSELVREGAQRIIRQAVEGELQAFLEEHSAERDARGRRTVVRNGYLPSREVLTGIGPVGVRVPRTRDRSGAGRCFRSELLPPYLAALPEEGEAGGGGVAVAVFEGDIDERLP